MDDKKNKWTTYKEVQADCLDLAQRKHADYGNDSIGMTGVEGIIIRMVDKICRLNTIRKNGKMEVKEESVEDTLKDIVNYATYGLILLSDPNIWYKE